MGHGLNNTVQDVLVRFERMRGRERSGSRAPTTPASPPRTWWSGCSAKEGTDPLRPGPRGVRGAGLGLRARDRRRHPGAAQGHRRSAATGRAPTSRSTTELSRAVREVFVAAAREGADLSRQVHHQLVPALPHRPLQRGGGEGGGGRASIWHSATRSRTAAATSPSRPPGPRRCWATPASRCIPRTSATRRWSGKTLRLPLVGPR